MTRFVMLKVAVMTERDFYSEAAEQLPSEQLVFMNYGYADSCEQCEWILPKDLRQKRHISLVNHVMSGVTLSGRTVLEVGSGRGGNCDYLCRYAQAEKICGIDLCEANVRFCRKVHRHSKLTFLRGDAEQLPFQSEAFDVVLNLESSHCYQHFERFLSEVHRVLKPHGTFCYADLWFLEFLELDWKLRKKALEEAPFVLVSQEDISEQVLRALASEEGLTQTIRGMANETNRTFVETIVKRLRLVQFMLATGKFSYWTWRFQKT